MRVRDQRREWGGDASGAVHLATMTAIMDSDFGFAVRLGALPPDGEALPIEAAHPEVRYAVFQASLAMGNADRAQAIADSARSPFQSALFSADILAATGATSALIGEGFERAWSLTAREEDRAAVWFGAAQAGIEQLPGQSDLDARTDDIPVIVSSQVDLANGRFAQAATRLRTRPNSESCVRMLSHALTRDGHLDEAVVELEAAADRFDNADHLYAAVALLVEADRLDDATRSADRALTRLPASLRNQRAFCHQVGIRKAHDARRWRDMATRARAWIDDQGSSAERRWLLVQALHNEGAFEKAWAVLKDEPPLMPDGPLTAQLWIVLSARFQPGPSLTVEILDIHDRFAGGEAAVTRAAINAFVNMGEAKGAIGDETLERYRALMRSAREPLRPRTARTPSSGSRFQTQSTTSSRLFGRTSSLRRRG